MIRIFIGFDPSEAVAFGVLARSLMARSSRPVAIAPVALQHLAAFRRKRDPLQSTEFSFSRFMVPWMCGYEGWAIFMDCDMLARGDVAELWALRDERYAVQVVKHAHVPRESTKFLGAAQTRYAMKNWSSVMLMNCNRCRFLSPAYVNHASGLELHQFRWLSSDVEIGAIPSEWNHLVGYDPYREDAKLVHFTLGGPWFDEYRSCEYSAEWFEEREALLAVRQRK